MKSTISGASLALLGAGQGLVLWWLWSAFSTKSWPATEPVLSWAILYATVAGPIAIYFTQGVDHFPSRIRAISVATYFLLFAGLGAYSAWVAGAVGANRNYFGSQFSEVAAALVLGFVSLGLLVGFDFEMRWWRYERLFNYAWRNGILVFTSIAMTATVWMVFFAGASLMGLIGIKWVLELIAKPEFVFPVTGLMFAQAFYLGLTRSALTESVRKFWLSISSWILPLVLMFSVLWIVVVPFTGFDLLFKTKNAALLMLWFAALAVKFANCAYLDGEIAWPYPRWMSRLTQLAWLSLIPVVAIAWWALAQRIDQYGWSEQRLWAALIAFIALIYAVGYSSSWLRRDRWMHAIAQTNIVAAVVLCVGIVAFLTPVANVQRIAVNAHLDRILTGRGNLEPDWAYLRWRSGRFGEAALEQFAKGEGVPAGLNWAKQAGMALAERQQYSVQPKTITDQIILDKFAFYPKGSAISKTILAYVKSSDHRWEFDHCFTVGAKCAFLVKDMNADGNDEVMLFNSGSNTAQAVVYGLDEQDVWRRLGGISTPLLNRGMDLEDLNTAKAVPSEWQDLIVGNQRIRVHIARLRNYKKSVSQ